MITLVMKVSFTKLLTKCLLHRFTSDQSRHYTCKGIKEILSITCRQIQWLDYALTVTLSNGGISKNC